MKMSKEIKIALVAVVGILIMYFGINFLKGINLFSSHNYYYNPPSFKNTIRSSQQMPTSNVFIFLLLHVRQSFLLHRRRLRWLVTVPA